jgi:HNH endonuclease/AP2 domain
MRSSTNSNDDPEAQDPAFDGVPVGQHPHVPNAIVDPTSPSGLRGIAGQRKGKPVGWLDGYGYWGFERPGRKVVRVHRIVLEAVTRRLLGAGVQVDHINGVRHDNRPSNLRPATQSENLANTRLRSNNTSGLKGASFHKQAGRWRAAIRIDGRQRHLGLFDTPEEAHAAYVRAARELFGEFARAA